MIELKSVNKIYETEAEKVHALKSVNLTIDKGEFISIMGQSGSGKTTLMNILGCLDNPTSGEYNIYQSNIASLDDDQRSILRGKLFGFVFQSYNLLPRLTAVEQVELPLIYQNVDNRKEKAAIKVLGDTIKGTKFEGKSFIAGGYVRDLKMGIPSKDIDAVPVV